jgi:hypothetical protein
MPASFPRVGAKNQGRLPQLPHDGGFFAVILPRATEKKLSARHTPEELLVHLSAYPFSTGSSGVSSVIDARGSVRVIAGAPLAAQPVKSSETLIVYAHRPAALGLEHDWSVGRLAAADPTAALLEVS